MRTAGVAVWRGERVHIGGKPDAAVKLEKALRWLAAAHVDAVLFPGDIANSGLIGELETFAAVWHAVFPGGRGPDGRPVEVMIATGNHDVDAWQGQWKKFSEAEMLVHRFCYRDNPEKVWQRLFGLKWDVVWRREVKGYTFIGSHWSTFRPPFDAFMKEHAATLDPDKPFFYCQHAHPKGTCHDGYAAVDDGGASVRTLARFPNAVAITGHSHCAVSDERTVWQGAFTSIGAGCLHEGTGGFTYDNVAAFWHPKSLKNVMASMADPTFWGGDAKGGCCERIDVFRDRLVVHRHSVTFGRPIGPAWTVPIPARPNGPFDFSKRIAARRAQGAIPQFAPEATLTAVFCPNGHRLAGAAYRGKPCVYVTFPRARTVKGSRVFDYLVDATPEGGRTVTRKIVAPGFAYPEEDANLPGECLFSCDELPVGQPIRFAVTPRDCFGLAGRPLAVRLPVLPSAGTESN